MDNDLPRRLIPANPAKFWMIGKEPDCFDDAPNHIFRRARTVQGYVGAYLVEISPGLLGPEDFIHS